MDRPGIAISVALAVFAAGCRVVRHEAPAGLAHARPIQLDAERAWRVVAQGEVRGYVVQLDSVPEPDRPRARCFSVQNALQQELGLIDGLGRAWRYELHESEPRWVATGTVLEGARAILGLDAPAELVDAGAR